MITKFKNNTMYRHKRLIDVDMYVIKSYDDSCLKLEVKWWHRHGYFIVDDELTVERKELINWTELRD